MSRVKYTTGLLADASCLGAVWQAAKVTAPSNTASIFFISSLIILSLF